MTYEQKLVEVEKIIESFVDDLQCYEYSNLAKGLVDSMGVDKEELAKAIYYVEHPDTDRKWEEELTLISLGAKPQCRYKAEEIIAQSTDIITINAKVKLNTECHPERETYFDG